MVRVARAAAALVREILQAVADGEFDEEERADIVESMLALIQRIAVLAARRAARKARKGKG